ncbi:hypothetical protein HBI31_037420 [Parastagonospora nodorum]|nr:hypothetical protein HBH82_051860 [Parastagonospora nodorum]KAH4680401.1 hypothetical protein HBH78_134930 [Parastagonospora nodorum]KAH4711900.1 hypothetical protein HBH67_012720 [Parastagonospora nodorum]KAH4763609.1 hypothetical protein HBH63_189860 [Parastagonospora nodorum]KAH4787597.1 hypothetical protein HBH62_064870 [Parastagonospora nodorum]
MLFTLIALGTLSLTRAANLPVRQRDSCQHNDCYRAVWGNDPNLVPVLGVVSCERHLTTTELIYPLVTSTFAEVTLTTTTVSCITQSGLTSSTPTPTSPSTTTGLMYEAEGINALTVVPPTTSITTTIFGAVPTSATGACDTGNYRSACSCKSEFGITSATITLLSTTSTSYITATFTNTLTTGPACPSPSSSVIIPSSSTSSNGTFSSISSTSSLPSETSSGSSSVSSLATITSASSSASSTDSASSAGPATISSSSTINGTTSSSTSTGPSSSFSSTVSSASVNSTLSSAGTSSLSSSGTASFSSTSSANVTSTASTIGSYSSPSSSSASSALSSPSSTTGSLSSTGSTSSSSSVVSSSSTISNSSSTVSQSSTLVTLTSSTPSSGLPTPTPVCTGNGVALCNGSCQDVRTSNDHCGLCGNKCSAGKACTNGVCTSTACDSNCEFLRLCNSNNGTSSCACAKESEGSGVCFDSAKFKCVEDDPGKPQPIRCSETASCNVGFVCVKEFCACTGTTAGICVSTEGCGSSGAEIVGSLAGFGEMMGRSARLF